MDAKTKSTGRRIRRGPEILIKELETKMKRLEGRVYKKNKETVHYIGAAILKRARFDFSSLTPEDAESIAKMTPRGVEIIDDIIEKASQN